MAAPWPPLPFETWQPTCDTLHAHAQVLGKIAAALAPPEPEFQHLPLRVTARGLETPQLPAPDGSGSFGVALDLHAHEAVVENVDGRLRRVPLTPNRAVADVTHDVLDAVSAVAGRVEITFKPQETAWSTPLDEDREHATYDEAQVADYFAAVSRAASVLAAFRAPYRGRSTQVNAWWGSFDVAVSLFSGRGADPPSQDFIMRNAMDAQEIAVGWWPGDARYPKPAFYAYAYPAVDDLRSGSLSPSYWNDELGEYVLDWEVVCATDDPFATAIAFARGFADHACTVCSWDPVLAKTIAGEPPPVA